jgi:hypothetical protein
MEEKNYLAVHIIHYSRRIKKNDELGLNKKSIIFLDVTFTQHMHRQQAET